jgi:hypothetical protein
MPPCRRCKIPCSGLVSATRTASSSSSPELRFLAHSIWKVALTSLHLPPSLPHPGSRAMVREGRQLREVAERVLAKARGSGGDELLQRLVTARDPATGDVMPDGLIVDMWSRS